MIILYFLLACPSCKNLIQLDEAITRHRSDFYHDRCLLCCSCKQKLHGSFAFRKNERLCLDCASRRTFSAKSLTALFEVKEDSSSASVSVSSRAPHTNDKSPRNRYWENPPTAIAELPDLPAADLLRNTSNGILAVQQRRATEVNQAWKSQQTSTKPPDDLDVTSIASDTKPLQRSLPTHSPSKKVLPSIAGLSTSGGSAGKGHPASGSSTIAIPAANSHQLPLTNISQSLPSTHSHALHSSSDSSTGSGIRPELSASPPNSNMLTSPGRSPATSPPASPRTGHQMLLGISKGRFTPSPTGGSPSVRCLFQFL